MLFLYNSFLRIVALLLPAAGLFHGKTRAFVRGRKGLIPLIEKSTAGLKSKCVWVHCASLGEFEQGRPVIEALKKEFPAHPVVVTFFSSSGYEIRKNYAGADYIFYLPWDTAGNATRFVDAINPALAIFVKYEFWYHYTAVLSQRNIPLVSVSSIFRRNQIFFKPRGSFFRSLLSRFSYFFVQNHESVKLLHSIGITSCSVAGDTRFDRVHSIVTNAEEIPVAAQFKANEKVMVVGSCWPEDLEVLLPLINEHRLKFILAPHEISEAFLGEIEKSIHVKSIRYSTALHQNPEPFSVLIIDNIGMLSRLYRYGEFAFIGGAFGKGLHNILEAACYGIPVLFGNKRYEKFQEAVDLINQGGAFAVADYADLKNKYEILNIPETFLLACDVTRQYVENNLGATEKIMQYCRKLLLP